MWKNYDVFPWNINEHNTPTTNETKLSRTNEQAKWREVIKINDEKISKNWFPVEPAPSECKKKRDFTLYAEISTKKWKNDVF